MASLTIRKLKDETKQRLRVRAAENGRSLEAEARAVLDRAVLEPGPSKPRTGLDLFAGMRAVVEKYGGVELEEFPDEVLAPSSRDRRAKRAA